MEFNRSIKTSAGQIRTGNMVDIEGGIYRVVKFQVRPGQQIHMDLKDVRTGKKLLKKVRPGENMDLVDMTKRKCEVQYVMGDQVFMTDLETGDTVEGPLAAFTGKADLVLPGVEAATFWAEDQLVMVTLPSQVRAKVVAVDPSDVVGQVLATLENGAKVRLPDKVAKGQTAVFRTDTGEYMGLEA